MKNNIIVDSDIVGRISGPTRKEIQDFKKRIEQFNIDNKEKIDQGYLVIVDMLNYTIELKTEEEWNQGRFDLDN